MNSISNQENASGKPNDIALAQPPGETSGDSQSNQAAQTSETGIQGGCCQQRLVLRGASDLTDSDFSEFEKALEHPSARILEF